MDFANQFSATGTREVACATSITSRQTSDRFCGLRHKTSGCLSNSAQYHAQNLGRCRTHMAEVLRDDQIRIQLSKNFAIHGVQAFGASHELANQAVDLESREAMRSREWMTTRLPRVCAGKSHSWLTPTTSSPRPSANNISVAEGRRETMRMLKL